MGQRVLIVDDEPNLLRLIGYALEVEGYEISTAENGFEALEKVQSDRPDLIILDVMLPDMSGVEVCERLRGDRETARLPIIMLSARTQVPDKIRGLNAGADEYVTKPVDSDEMVARVTALLERTRRLNQVPAERLGRVLGFLGVKGGVGTSTVALNVALSLAKGEKSVIAIELRPSGGTFSLQLGQTPVEDLTSLLSCEASELSESELSSRLQDSHDGLKVLFGPQALDQCETIRPELAAALVEKAKELADFTVFDLPCQPSEATREVVERCDFVSLVLEPDPACVAAGKHLIGSLKRSGIAEGVVGAVIVNRMGLSVQTLLSELLPEIRPHLGCGIVGVIPPAQDLCLEALKSGSPLLRLQPNNIVSVTLSELAERLASAEVSALEVF